MRQEEDARGHHGGSPTAKDEVDLQRLTTNTHLEKFDRIKNTAQRVCEFMVEPMECRREAGVVALLLNCKTSGWLEMQEGL